MTETIAEVPKSLFKRALIWIGDSFLWLCMLIGFVWAFGAIWFHASMPELIRKPLAVVYLAFGIWVIRKSIRPKGAASKKSNPGLFSGKWARPSLAATVPLVYLTTLFVQPSNDRQWAGDQQVLPIVEMDGDRVTIKNFRDFVYETPEKYQPRFRAFSFDLNQLSSVWFIVQRFTRFNGMAHTFLSFELDTPEGKKYFSISVEIRREADELYSPLAGLFRHYELMYVVGSEQDLIGVRTNVRPDDRIYLFPINAEKSQVRKLFERFAERIETLRENPEFYNTLLSNCTNNIVAHTKQLTDQPISILSPRIILPGYSDRLAYDLNLVGEPNESFEDVKDRCRIDEVARQAGITGQFSNDIRSKINKDLNSN